MGSGGSFSLFRLSSSRQLANLAHGAGCLRATYFFLAAFFLVAFLGAAFFLAAFFLATLRPPLRGSWRE